MRIVIAALTLLVFASVGCKSVPKCEDLMVEFLSQNSCIMPPAVMPHPEGKAIAIGCPTSETRLDLFCMEAPGANMPGCITEGDLDHCTCQMAMDQAGTKRETVRCSKGYVPIQLKAPTTPVSE